MVHRLMKLALSMDDAYLLCQRHAGDGIIDALLYRLGLVEIDWQLSGSLLCLRWSDGCNRQDT